MDSSENNVDTFSQRFLSKPFVPVVALFLVIVLGAVATSSLNNRAIEKAKPAKTNAPAAQESAALNASPHTIVYGEWKGERTIISTLNLQNGEVQPLAQLPLTTKKVSVLSQDELLYIADTDVRDHGKSLVSYSLSDGKTAVKYTVENGFGIDDYVISPNKQYAAVWEVAVSPEGTVLGGKSRVYGIQLTNASRKFLLFDEQSTENNPIHYPRAVTDSGEVFLDRFLPNSGAGWAYGMSTIRFDGANKQSLAQMANGTYGTQPQLSPDGRYLAFAGYEDRSVSGTTENDGGHRRALTRANTVELLNLQTKTRQKLSNLSRDNIYPSVRWEGTSGNIIYSQVAKNLEESGMYVYDRSTQASRKMEIGNNENSPTNVYVASLGNGKVLTGVPDSSVTQQGNLGETYAAPFTSFAVVDEKADQTAILSQSAFMQFITITDVDYFAGAQAAAAEDEAMVDGRKMLQLETFTLKPSLVPVRQSQQTGAGIPSVTPAKPGLEDKTPRKGKNGTCAGLAWEICSAQMYGDEDYHTSMTTKVIADTWNNGAWNTCRGQVLAQINQEGICIGSPLYLYGAEGTKVSVKIHTPISNEIPSYNDGYDVTLLSDGKFSINNKEYDSIDYDYTAAIPVIRQPKYGTIVSKAGVEKTLRGYAHKLGFNQNETEDLVRYGEKAITKPYVLVSFFDQKTSKQILPISFKPTPDTYINYVFYFKQFDTKPNYTPVPPVFPAITERKGFTAVEISGIAQ